jgi:cytoskeletal protein RodZ
LRPKPPPITENSEEERAFLQKRVALFWKAIFFIVLIGSARAWWQARRASQEDSPSPADVGGSRPATMAIDLGGRSAS